MNDYKDLIFGPGDILFDTKTPLDVAYFILEGAVDLELSLGEKTIKLHLGENQFLGDAGVAVSQKPEIANIKYHGRAIAVGKVTVVAIPIADIKQELAACPPLLKAWIASFVGRMLNIVEELSAA